MNLKGSFPKPNSVTLCVIRFLLTFCWLLLLKETDSYFSVYVFCALLSTACIADNERDRNKATGKITVRKRVYATLFALLFSFAVMLSNYRLFEPVSAAWKTILLLLVSGFSTAWNVLLFIIRRGKIPSEQTEGLTDSCSGITVFLIVSGFYAAINLFILFTVAYPGYVTVDTVDELNQFVTGAYSNHHPFYHALFLKLFTEAGRGIFGNINAGIALFLVIQILFLSACFGYAAMTMREAGFSLLTVVTAAVIWLLSPYHIVYSVTVWKDVTFGGALLLFTAALFRILKDIGSRKANECVLLVGAVGFALMRSNGLFALLITFVAVFFTLRKEDRRLLLLFAGVIIGAFLLKHPVLSLLHVTQPDTVEALSIPVQQVARVITEGGDLNGQEEELQLFFEMKKVPSDYREFISDPIKNHMREKGYINGHMGEFLGLWAKIGVKNPGLYVKAWIDQTRGYFNGGYEYWIYSDYVVKNDLGITAGTPVESIRGLLYKWYEKYYGKSIFQPLHSIGFHVWLIALCFFFGAVHKKKEFLLSVPQLVIVLTLLISTPVFCEFRYAYSLFTTAPFLLFTTFGRQKPAKK